MRIRLLSPLGGRPTGATFDHDDAGAEALFAAGFAEPVEVIEPVEQHVTPEPVEPVPSTQVTPPATTTTKRTRPAQRR